MAKNKEKELAFQLFIHSQLSQKDIAEKIGVSEKTLSNWSAKDNWDALKLARDSSNMEAVSDLKLMLAKQIKKNKEKMESDDFTKSDADTMLEIARTIETMEGEISLRVYVQVLEEFMDSIPYNLKEFKTTVADFQMKFLLSKSKQS